MKDLVKEGPHMLKVMLTTALFAVVLITIVESVVLASPSQHFQENMK